MIQTGLELNKIGKFLKEYLSVLIVIPAFIGGVWQSYELMNISYSYIRFFSISQIVPDGILIIMFIIIAFSFQIFSIYVIKLTRGERKPESVEHFSEKEFEKYRKSKLRLDTFIFGIAYVFAMVYLFSLFINKPTLENLKFFVTFMLSVSFFLNVFLKNCYYYALDKHKKFYKYCNLLLLLFYLVGIFYFSVHIRNIFLLPSNNNNIEVLKKEIANKHPNSEQRLLYFNDKYIFFEVIDKLKKDKKGKVINHSKHKIYILKFESLFDDDSIKS